MPDGEAAEQSEAWGEPRERPFSRADKARRGAVATLAVLGVFVLLLGPAPLLAPFDGLARVLGVGTGGNLLVLGGPPDQPPPAYDPTNAATPPPTPAWLWEWDRAAQRWRVSPFPVPVVAGDIAISWGAGNTFGGGGLSIQDGYGAYIWVLEQVSGDSRLYQAFVLAQ